MDTQSFRKHAHQIVDWMADYLEKIETFPVKSQAQLGDLLKQLPLAAPKQPEAFEHVFEDFQRLILPGITHWQHPRFFAYFPANSSPPSVLAEMLVSAMAPQCMLWETSPAANELETRMMEWLRSLVGLPTNFAGTIQDSASTATLCALIAARERALNFKGIAEGLFDQSRLTVYASQEVHSSIDKAVKVIGLGLQNLRKVPVDRHFRMQPQELLKMIQSDRAKGFRPACVVACFGTTGVGALDPLNEIADICENENLFLHVDAAWAGSALILEENQHHLASATKFDSFVFDPHKWLFTNFDCAAHFLKDPQELQRSLSVLPSYLQSAETGKAPEYRDWTIPLGRRFRALKLWFVMRCYGTEGLKQMIRHHIDLAKTLYEKISESETFEIASERNLALFTFGLKPTAHESLEVMNERNLQLLETINREGRIYLTRTEIAGKLVLRFSVGQTTTQARHMDEAWAAIQSAARLLI